MGCSQQEEMTDEEQFCRKIMETHGKDTILFQRGHISKEARWALMAVSDTWLVTSLRQGYTFVLIFWTTTLVPS